MLVRKGGPFWLLFFCSLLTADRFNAAEYTVLPRVDADTITVDGDLSDWDGRPGRFVLDGPAHVTYRARGNSEAWVRQVLRVI